MPLLQNVYTSWSTASSSRSSVGQVLELLRLPEGSFSDLPEPIPFRDRIEFDSVSFHYPGRWTTPTVQELSFTIPAGTAVAITGKTGAGKSTLADLLMALLEPDGGRILVDGTPVTAASAGSWQRNIAHVPQSTFLADTTIERNIALGLPQEPIDRDRIVEAAKKAQLDDFVRSLADGYETIIGERGIRLSGGQRQRLGLARAIYKQTPLLVLDEATSALDEATETAVIQALDELRAIGRTIVIIAHRRSTIAHCDLVVHLDKGRVAEIRGVDEVRQGRKTS